ncbi:MAG: alanine racemase [Proteobacteria bacterium]|nr:alanine racemase [Pseudomonadota bacterium]
MNAVAAQAMPQAMPLLDMPLDTPLAVVDLDVAERNIAGLQALCDRQGVANRPHIKTHKSIRMARLQLAAGAIGITCQKLGEAEVMAAAGIADILISYNVVGVAKHHRLRALADRCTLSLCCDSREAADGYAQALAGRAGAPLRLLVECDTGRQRCGVTTAGAAADLAAHIAGLPGLVFDGLLLYPPEGELSASAAFIAQARRECAARGQPLRTLCSGGTPNRARIGTLGETEYRAGTYVYNDRQMVALGAATLADCALTVVATVVSHPEPGRVLIDAGSKTLSSDLSGQVGHGLLIDYPQARLYKLAEEHGFVDVSACAEVPAIGQQVRVLPNHACVVSNLADRLLCTRGGVPAGHLDIDARGRVS